MSQPSALVGAVLFVWFPEDENLLEPGPKFRPALIINADDQTRQLLVAYGTSQHTNQQRAGEITVTPLELPKLSRDTKFSLGKARWLPITPEYFCEHETSGFSLVGFFPKKRMTELYLRAQEVFPDL